VKEHTLLHQKGSLRRNNIRTAGILEDAMPHCGLNTEVDEYSIAVIGSKATSGIEIGKMSCRGLPLGLLVFAFDLNPSTAL
jgi:hypothetical protein